MVCLFLVEHAKYLRSRGCLIGLRPESVSIVEDNSCFALPIKLPDRLLDLAQFVVAQLWQGGLNFSDSTHAHNYTSEHACRPFFIDGRKGGNAASSRLGCVVIISLQFMLRPYAQSLSHPRGFTDLKRLSIRV